MEPLSVIMLMSLVLAIFSGVSFYIYAKRDTEEKQIIEAKINRQTSYFETLNDLSKRTAMPKEEVIREVRQLAMRSAEDLTDSEADERIAMIFRQYRNNVFFEQLPKATYAIPHLFRIQSARFFIERVANEFEDEEMNHIADTLNEIEEVVLAIYQDGLNWGSPQVKEHVEQINAFLHHAH